MSSRPFSFVAAALTSAALVTAPFSEALAWTNTPPPSNNWHGPGKNCGNGGGVTINKPVTIYKPTTITKNIDIYKPTTITKNIDIYKPVTINKDINITKNIDNSKNITINKNIDINKSIVINKGGGAGSASAEASAFAEAMAQASASASASVNNNVVMYGGGSYEYVTVNNHGGDIGAVQAAAECQMQQANVVKAIHAVCVSGDGREFPASHMVGDTWLAASYEGEVMRCIPGAHLKVVIGDVLQSDQGMAGTYGSGTVMECAENEALGHFKDGVLKCAPKLAVPDCTERTNLRRYGTGDMFFSYQASVCVSGAKTSARESHELDVTGMTLEGGVGDGSAN